MSGFTREFHLQRRTLAWWFGLGAVAAGLGLLGCGGGDEVERLEAASRDLAEARVVVEDARATVAERQSDVDAAQEKLSEARAALREAEDHLAERESAVDLQATDAVLFRAIQKRLLEDGALEGTAISARVDSGVVTLTGSVPKAELAERAVKIAGETAGVVSVESRIRVPPAPPKKADD